VGLVAAALVALAAAPAAGAPARIGPGAPAVSQGANGSYFIWHDAAGWHLRTTAGDRRHRFHGRVLPALGGEIVEARPIQSEPRDRFSHSLGGIAFDFSTYGGIDGFDWRTSSGCSRFELLVDGRPRPARVKLGGRMRNPRRVPFERCR